jgi:uncharacterized protein
LFELIPDYPIEFWIFAAIAVTAVGIGKAGFGGGIGTLATPLIALTIPVSSAAAIMLPLLIICDAFSVWHYRKCYHKGNLALMLPGAIVGITAGAFCFWNFIGNERMLQVVVGLLSVCFVFFQWMQTRIYEVVRRRRPRQIEGFFMGAASGFTSTIAHAGGPPVTIFLLPQKMQKDLFVGTTVIFFAITNSIKLIPYYYLNLLQIGQIKTIIFLAPLSFIGVRLGLYFKEFFSEVWFNRVVYSILLLTGVQLIIGKSFFYSLGKSINISPM